MPEDTNVTDPNAGAVPTATGNSAPGANVPVSGAGSVDGSDLKTRLDQAELRSKKLEGDINNLKSTYDRNAFQREQEWKQREAEYQKQLRDLQMKSLPEDQRPSFERQILEQDFETIRRENEMLKQQKAEQDQIKEYTKFFMGNGVDPAHLDTSSIAALVNTGWEAMSAHMQRLQAELESLKKAPAEPSPDQQPPDVHIPGSTPAPKGPKWADLEKRYGNRETVYRLVETGQLPPSIIPE